VQHRLTPDERTELLARYQAGEGAYGLASAYQVHRSTVTRLVTAAGVRRSRSLTTEQLQEAIALYGQGWSCARLDQHFGKGHGTLWLTLTRAGVRLRSKPGRR
jgi:hypothetical protein